MCDICQCKCEGTFTRDTLTDIHQAKHYEEWNRTQKKKDHPSPSTIAALHPVLGVITGILTEVAKDSVIESLQSSPINKHLIASASSNHAAKLSNHATAPSYHAVRLSDHAVASSNHAVTKSNHIDLTGSVENPSELDIQVQTAIERSLALAAVKLASHPKVANNMPLKQELRNTFGGKPTNILHRSGETVSHHRVSKRASSGSHERCPRTSRNNLHDLSSSNHKNTPMNCIVKQMFKVTSQGDKNEKKKVKYVQDILEGKILVRKKKR